MPKSKAHSTFSNLPAPLSTFIGREREIAEVKYLLETNRLVTITGPGGADFSLKTSEYVMLRKATRIDSGAKHWHAEPKAVLRESGTLALYFDATSEFLQLWAQISPLDSSPPGR